MTQVSSGIHDIGIGVPDLADSIAYWERFGYRVGETGTIDAARAKELYSVDSSCRSVRMFHLDSDVGLVRLMQWDQPLGTGLQMAPLRTPGNRWSVHKTDDIVTAWNHGEVLRRQGQPINMVGPVINARLQTAVDQQRPFLEPVSVSHNLQIFQPLYQHVLMQRFNIDVGTYGTVNEDSMFRCSEACHMAIVVYTDKLEAFDFYDQVLGLKRTIVRRLKYEMGSAPTVMFDLREGESFTELDFDDPRFDPRLDGARSGRLRVFAVEAAQPADDRRSLSGPGQLGYSLYTLKSHDVSKTRDMVKSSSATDVSDLLNDEFGRSSFAFRAPDGFVWQVVAED